jgi:release factor glutamine methyltransferase
MGYPERGVAEIEAYRALIARRASREPLSHLTARREFWSLDFEVTEATLDPRPDSETLIEAVLARLPDRHAPLSVLDLGTGSGCLLLALLTELPMATGVGIDIAEDTLAVARRNALRHGLGRRSVFLVGNWGEALAGSFDVIVSNPPYIPTGEIELLQPEVARFEPRRALDGGDDGLEAYRRLGPEIVRLLGPEGPAVLEFGQGQGSAVSAIMSSESLLVRGFAADLSGHDRCIVLEKG